jgi:hypothetical protein
VWGERVVRRFEVSSFTSPDKVYAVCLLADGTWTCSCPHYLYRLARVRGECKHIQLVRSSLKARVVDGYGRLCLDLDGWHIVEVGVEAGARVFGLTEKFKYYKSGRYDGATA